jgi:hypothetical protein
MSVRPIFLSAQSIREPYHEKVTSPDFHLTMYLQNQSRLFIEKNPDYRFPWQSVLAKKTASYGAKWIAQAIIL